MPIDSDEIERLNHVFSQYTGHFSSGIFSGDNKLIPKDQISRTQQLLKGGDMYDIKSVNYSVGDNSVDTQYYPTVETSVYKMLKVKRLSEHAVIPTKAYGDAGWDLYYSGEGMTIITGSRSTLETGLAIEIPYGYVGLIWPRSGLAVKKGIDVFAGVIDSSYRGEVKVCLYNTGREYYEINRGDRIAQIQFQRVPEFELIEVDKLDNTERNEGGFGSTGK